MTSKNQIILSNGENQYTLFLDQMLGSGAISEVFKGIRKKDKQEVAIKVLRDKTLQDQKKNVYYEREFKESQQIKDLQDEDEKNNQLNENVLRVLDVMESEANLSQRPCVGNKNEGDQLEDEGWENEKYIVTEICNKNTLFQHMSSNAFSFNVDQVIEMSIQIAQGLLFLHKNHLMHRDLKPENIFLHEVLNDQGKKRIIFKIGDFGLIKNFRMSDRFQTMVGTINYMSPEIINQKNYSYFIDFWSFGCIVHELHQGQQKFWDTTVQGVVQKILQYKTQNYLLLSSNSLERIIFKCLDLIPETRYKDAEEIIYDLKQLKEQKNNKNSQQNYIYNPQLFTNSQNNQLYFPNAQNIDDQLPMNQESLILQSLTSQEKVILYSQEKKFSFEDDENKGKESPANFMNESYHFIQQFQGRNSILKQDSNKQENNILQTSIVQDILPSFSSKQVSEELLISNNKQFIDQSNKSISNHPDNNYHSFSNNPIDQTAKFGIDQKQQDKELKQEIQIPKMLNQSEQNSHLKAQKQEYQSRFENNNNEQNSNLEQKKRKNFQNQEQFQETSLQNNNVEFLSANLQKNLPAHQQKPKRSDFGDRVDTSRNEKQVAYLSDQHQPPQLQHNQIKDQQIFKDRRYDKSPNEQYQLSSQQSEFNFHNSKKILNNNLNIQVAKQQTQTSKQQGGQQEINVYDLIPKQSKQIENQKKSEIKQGEDTWERQPRNKFQQYSQEQQFEQKFEYNKSRKENNTEKNQQVKIVKCDLVRQQNDQQQQKHHTQNQNQLQPPNPQGNHRQENISNSSTTRYSSSDNFSQTNNSSQNLNFHQLQPQCWNNQDTFKFSQNSIGSQNQINQNSQNSPKKQENSAQTKQNTSNLIIYSKTNQKQITNQKIEIDQTRVQQFQAGSNFNEESRISNQKKYRDQLKQNNQFPLNKQSGNKQVFEAVQQVRGNFNKELAYQKQDYNQNEEYPQSNSQINIINENKNFINKDTTNNSKIIHNVGQEGQQIQRQNPKLNNPLSNTLPVQQNNTNQDNTLILILQNNEKKRLRSIKRNEKAYFEERQRAKSQYDSKASPKFQNTSNQFNNQAQYNQLNSDQSSKLAQKQGQIQNQQLLSNKLESPNYPQFDNIHLNTSKEMLLLMQKKK